MLDRQITFGGDVIPAKVASLPHYIRPTRKMTVVQVAGTNREIVDMEDAWESYDQPYSFYVGDGTEDSIQEALDDVARVLFKAGWQRLDDNYDPEHYRLAYYQGGFDSDNRYTRLGKFDVIFRCRPERYLVGSDIPIAFSGSGTITNPTSFRAKPLIHIVGSGNGSIIIAGQEMRLTGMVDYLNVDCDTMNVYRLSSENRNNLMEGVFPVLFEGDNNVSFSGGITSITITPRFWVI